MDEVSVPDVGKADASTALPLASLDDPWRGPRDSCNDFGNGTVRGSPASHHHAVLAGHQAARAHAATYALRCAPANASRCTSRREGTAEEIFSLRVVLFVTHQRHPARA